MNTNQFLNALADCEGTITLSKGIATFENGTSFEIKKDAPFEIEFSDWRVQDGSKDDLPPSLSGEGKLSLGFGGYGAILDGVTPKGDIFSVGIEFDAGAVKLMVFPPRGESPKNETLDQAVVFLVVQTEGVIAQSGYSQFGTFYGPNGSEMDCDIYKGQAVIDQAMATYLESKEKTIAQKLEELFDENKDECFGLAPLTAFVPTEFEKAAKDAFDADYKKTATGSWTQGLVSVEDVTAQLGKEERDANGARYMVFADGSALTFDNGGMPRFAVKKWVRN